MEIINAIESMTLMSILVFEKIDAVQCLISEGQKTKIELENLFIGFILKKAGCKTTITFDKKAAKSDLFELLV